MKEPSDDSSEDYEWEYVCESRMTESGLLLCNGESGCTDRGSFCGEGDCNKETNECEEGNWGIIFLNSIFGA